MIFLQKKSQKKKTKNPLFQNTKIYFDSRMVKL